VAPSASPDRWSVTIKCVEKGFLGLFSEGNTPVKGARVDLSGDVHVTDSVGEVFYGENSFDGFANGDYPCTITKDGYMDISCRFELHSDRCDITLVNPWGSVTRLEWRPNTPTIKHHRATFLVGMAKELVVPTVPTVPIPVITPTVPTVPTVPEVPTVPAVVTPVTTPSAEVGMYTLRCGIVKMPNFDPEKASAFVESNIAPTVAVILQPFGYSYTGHVDNWNQNYFDLQFTSPASPPIPLAVIIAAIAVIGIVAAALLVISLTWYKQAAVQEQIQQNLTDLLNKGKITPRQYLDATGAQQQAIASGTAGWMAGLQQLTPLVILLVIGFIVLKAVPERKVIEEKKAPPVTPEVLAH